MSPRPQVAQLAAAPANRWPIATAHLQRGVPGLRYPRTLYGADGAFPQDATYACALERPHVGPGGEWWLYAAVFVITFAAGAAGFGCIGYGAALIAAGVACWRLARREG